VWEKSREFVSDCLQYKWRIASGRAVTAKELEAKWDVLLDIFIFLLAYHLVKRE
jgi:hypothetical protein